MKDKYYTVEEAAEILGFKEQVVRNYISLGKIKSVKILHTTAITKEEVERQLRLRENLNKK